MVRRLSPILLVAFVVVGCGGSSTPSNITTGPVATTTTPGAPRAVKFTANADAGVPVSISDPTQLVKMVASRSVATRQDPFSMLAAEAKYDQSQRAERFLEENGGFSFDYEAPPEKDDTPVLEPQPYRRLAGIVVGENGISALIDMGDGQFQNVRAGQKLGEWTVVSIDADRAILRRPGNKLPREISVPLQGPSSGGGGNSGGGNANPGGNGRGRGEPGTGGPGNRGQSDL